MTLPFTEAESMTEDYFMADKGSAYDIFFKSSFACNWFLKQKNGLYKRYPGGTHIEVPLEYDEASGGTFTRTSALNSDDRNMIVNAKFLPKNYYGNATIYLTDEAANSGDMQKISLIKQRVAAAQKKMAKDMATDFWAAGGDTGETLTGVPSVCSETAGTPYGGIEEEDLLSSDGNYHWQGRTTTTAELISIAVIRAMGSTAKLQDGMDGKPDIFFLTEDLFNVLRNKLDIQQRYTEADETRKAGFTGLKIDKAMVVVDDFAPSGYCFGANSSCFGFATHSNFNFVRQPWVPLSPQAGKTMKQIWMGNMISSNRKGQILHTGLTTS